MAGWLTPTPGYAQPGRIYTPPAPPPQMMNNPAVSLQQSHLQSVRQQSQISETQRTNKVHLDAAAAIERASPSGRRIGGDRANIPLVQLSVTQVQPDSQGALLGLKKGDLLVTYDGQAPKSIEQLRDLAKQDQVKDRRRTLIVIRDGETLRFDVRPGPLGLSLQTKRSRIG